MINSKHGVMWGLAVGRTDAGKKGNNTENTDTSTEESRGTLSFTPAWTVILYILMEKIAVNNYLTCVFEMCCQLIGLRPMVQGSK